MSKKRPDPGSPRRPRIADALWIALAALALVRGALAFVPSTWGWGLNLLRFVPAGVGWTLWLVALLALVPALGRPLAAALDRAGEAKADGAPRVLAWGVWALCAAMLVWWLPDRVHFVGDFLLREGTAARGLAPSGLFPQALPLDVFLHYDLPRLLSDRFAIDTATTTRVLGALEAALLAILAAQFARAVAGAGSRAVAVTAVVFFGGYLGMYTGYGKAMAEMALLTAAVALFGLAAARGAGGLLPLGACVAVALTLHRSALGLLPALAVAWAFALGAGGARARLRRPATWAALGIPLAALGVMLPRIVHTMRTWDAVHFAPPEVRAAGGMLRAAFAGTRAIDLLDLLAVLSPLALAAPALLLTRRMRPEAPGEPVRRREGLLLAALAAPWIVMVVLIHPPQGMFRDWDNFTAAGVAFSLWFAWGLAGRLSEPGIAWLALAVTLGAASPALEWLVHHADLERGLARVESFVTEPPQRSDAERAKTWDFLGIRNAQLGRWEASADALARAATWEPSARVLIQWAMAEQARGNDLRAQEVYQRELAIRPDDALGWYGLATVSWSLDDTAGCRRAALEVLRLRPGNRQALALLERLGKADSTRDQAPR